MKIRPSTILLFVILIVINLGASAYISQSLLAQSAEENNYLNEIDSLGDRLDTLTERLDALIEFVEWKHGFIETIHPMEEPDIAITDKLVTIGVIPSTTQNYQSYIPYLDEIIEPALNEMAWSMGSDIEFDFSVQDATGQAAIHLEKVQGFRAMGINLVIGGMWSSHACASLSYCNDNDMLLFSPSSTSPLPAIPDDNLFRLAPTDIKQAPAIAKLLDSKGIEAVILIQRGDAWADGIYNYLEPEFNKLGGVIYNKIRYAGEATEFSTYLEDAEKVAVEAVEEYGWDKVAVELVSFSEATVIVNQAMDYPTLYNLTWFGSDGTVNSQQLIDDSPEAVEHLKLYSIHPVIPESDEYTDISAKYEDLTGTPLGYYTACSYDIAMILGKAVIESNTIGIDVLKEKIPEVSEDYYGITGLCRLDEADDRATSNFGIYSYHVKDGELGCYEVGMYTDAGEIIWYED